MSSKGVVFLVGIDEYKDKNLPDFNGDKTPSQDIRDILDIFEAKSKYCQYEVRNEFILLEQPITLQLLLDKLELILSPNSRYENVLIYFSGHGYQTLEGTIKNKKSKGYLGTNNAEIFIDNQNGKPDGQRNGLSFEQLGELIKDAVHLKSLVLWIDACHSGFAIEDNVMKESLSKLSRDFKFSLLASSHKSESSYTGKFKNALVKILKREDLGSITAAKIVTEVVNSLEGQRPIDLSSRANQISIINYPEQNYTEEENSYFYILSKDINRGRLIPFLGSDVNLYDRPIKKNKEIEDWTPKYKYPPTGKEIAYYLVSKLGLPPDKKRISFPLLNNNSFHAPMEDLENEPKTKILLENATLFCTETKKKISVGSRTLCYLSQYIDLKHSWDEILDEIKKIYDYNYEPNRIHRFVANLPKYMSQAGCDQHPLIVTTNYDNALEKAFEDNEIKYDLVFYDNSINALDKDFFFHQDPEGRKVKIENPQEYKYPLLKNYPTILKLYGSLNHIDCDNSLVITEDHYIEYLVSRNVSKLLPVKISSELNRERNKVLFLGYSVGNWNQRIILHRIWNNLQAINRIKGYVINSNHEAFLNKRLDLELWRSYGVQLIDTKFTISNYIEEFEKYYQQHDKLGLG